MGLALVLVVIESNRGHDFLGLSICTPTTRHMEHFSAALSLNTELKYMRKQPGARLGETSSCDLPAGAKLVVLEPMPLKPYENVIG